MKTPTLEYIANWFQTKTVERSDARLGILQMYETFAYDFFMDTDQRIHVNSFCQFLRVDPKRAIETVFALDLTQPVTHSMSEEEEPDIGPEVQDSPKVREELLLLLEAEKETLELP